MGVEPAAALERACVGSDHRLVHSSIWTLCLCQRRFRRAIHRLSDFGRTRTQASFAGHVNACPVAEPLGQWAWAGPRRRVSGHGHLPGDSSRRRVWAMAPCQPRRAQPAVSSMPNWGQSGGMGRAHSSAPAPCPAGEPGRTTRPFGPSRVHAAVQRGVCQRMTGCVRLLP
jgi:hypothetical protein